jgi:hypothetical protein
MKLLIVDGDDALRSLLAKELKERGIETRQSCNGDEAFYVWQQLGPWELVLSDYRFIPGVKIKDSFFASHLPVDFGGNRGTGFEQFLINKSESASRFPDGLGRQSEAQLLPDPEKYPSIQNRQSLDRLGFTKQHDWPQFFFSCFVIALEISVRELMPTWSIAQVSPE